MANLTPAVASKLKAKPVYSSYGCVSWPKALILSHPQGAGTCTSHALGMAEKATLWSVSVPEAEASKVYSFKFSI